MWHLSTMLSTSRIPPFYYGDWIKEPGVAIVSCNDGLRPVIMKLEATDEEAKIEYTPIDR